MVQKHLHAWALGALLLSGCAHQEEAAQPPRVLSRGSEGPPQVASLDAPPIAYNPDPALRTLPSAPSPSERPPELHYREITAPDRVVPGSISLGTTSQGSLLRQATLPPEGEHHAILRRCVGRNTNYGTEELIGLLLHAAAEVHEAHPGPRLMIGNLSQEGGGDISWSRSHNSGRDADLAFYVLRKGVPVEAPDLLTFGPDLKAKEDPTLTLDVPRNWALVKALLQWPEAQIQWLFAATWIKNALLEHAREIGEPPALLERAEAVVWQPTDSLPHNDHLHLRIYCSEQDRLEGCLNGAPVWPWVDDYSGALARRTEALCVGLEDPEEDMRRRVLGFLDRLRAQSAGPCVARVSLFDESPRLRLEALGLLSRWGSGGPEVVAALEALIRNPGGGVLAAEGEDRFTWPRAVWPAGERLEDRDEARDAAVLRRAYAALADLSAPEATPLLTLALGSRRVIADEGAREAIPEAALAADAAQHLMDPALVPALLEALEHPEGRVREAAARNLRRITNHSFSTQWGRPMSAAQRQQAAARWQQWWRERRDRARDQLVLEGFQSAKIKIKNLNDMKGIDALIKASAREDHVGYNAHRELGRLLGRWRAPLPASKRHAQWSQWWRKNKKRVSGAKR